MSDMPENWKHGYRRACAIEHTGGCCSERKSGGRNGWCVDEMANDQAANWLRLGATQGRTRNDRAHRIRAAVKHSQDAARFGAVT
jgi:hypothetical protein